MGFVVRVNVVWVVDGWDFVNWYMFVFIWVIVRCVYIVISFKMVLMNWMKCIVNLNGLK